MSAGSAKRASWRQDWRNLWGKTYRDQNTHIEGGFLRGSHLRVLPRRVRRLAWKADK